MGQDKSISFHHTFAPLRHPGFRRIFTGMFISQTGAEMLLMAVNWQVYLITRNPLSLGIIGLARFAPVLLFALVTGSLADLVSRKRLMFAAQAAIVAISCILAFLTLTGRVTTPAIYILIALYSTALTFNGPARQSLLPHLVPRGEFLQAVSLNSLMWQTAVIVGPAVGGFVIAGWGVGYVYLISALSFIAMNVALLFLPPVPKAAERGSAVSLRHIAEGIRFVRGNPLIWSTMLLDFFATFFASANTLMPIFAHDILRVGPRGLGFLYAAPSAGALIAGFTFASLHRRVKQGQFLIAAVGVFGVATAAFGLSRSFPLSLLFLFAAGAGDMVSSIIRNTMRQMVTPDRLRGRMISINMIFYMGGPQLGEVEAGLAASLLGTPLSVVFGGVGTLVATFFMVQAAPQLLEYISHEQHRTEEERVV